ncbi:MAG: hypothetical protein M3406_09825 [Chloroflexota bacterium]|nr:hypothetical protein [Chloroflexota bacterium]
MAAEWEQAHPDLIERAVYRPPSPLDPPEVLIFMNPGATDEQVVGLVCETIDPQIVQMADPELGVTLWDSNGDFIPHPDCPAT